MDSRKFIETFDSIYQDVYEYEWDEDLSRVTLWFSNEFNVDIQAIRIEYNGNRYSICREFLYEDYYGENTALLIAKEELLFYDCMKKGSDTIPDIGYEDSMGCPFFCELVGFFDIPFSWNDLKMRLGLMERACRDAGTTDFESVDKDTELYTSYQALLQKLFHKMQDLSPDLCNTRLKDSGLNKDHSLDFVPAYINGRNTILTGVGTEYLPQVCGKFSADKYTCYSGIRYFIIRSDGTNGRTVIADMELINKVNALFQSCHDDDFEYFVNYSLDRTNRVVMSCGEVWAVICPIQQEKHEACYTFEKNKIKSLEREFIEIAPPGLWKRTYDFSILNAEEFEAMCRDLLFAMNFQNIQVQGKTFAPDGGIDIIAEEEYSTLIRTEKRKWIFQCRHRKGQVSRKDFSEVRDLLPQFQADCYGLFYSGYLTPNTLERIESINANNPFIVQVWDHNGLEILLARYTDVSAKYFGL